MSEWKQFLKQNWLLVLSLLYILSPIDLLPEAILGPLGVIDDAGLIISLLFYSGFRYFFLGDKSEIKLPENKK